MSREHAEDFAFTAPTPEAVKKIDVLWQEYENCFRELEALVRESFSLQDAVRGPAEEERFQAVEKRRAELKKRVKELQEEMDELRVLGEFE
jgi:hypothetical protein